MSTPAVPDHPNWLLRGNNGNKTAAIVLLLNGLLSIKMSQWLYRGSYLESETSFLGLALGFSCLIAISILISSMLTFIPFCYLASELIEEEEKQMKRHRPKDLSKSAKKTHQDWWMTKPAYRQLLVKMSYLAEQKIAPFRYEIILSSKGISHSFHQDFTCIQLTALEMADWSLIEKVNPLIDRTLAAWNQQQQNEQQRAILESTSKGQQAYDYLRDQLSLELADCRQQVQKLTSLAISKQRIVAQQQQQQSQWRQEQQSRQLASQAFANGAQIEVRHPSQNFDRALSNPH